jgi:tRNA(adenine34) deaminase
MKTIKHIPQKKFMKFAIQEAIAGNKKFGKYPIGAVVVRDEKIISRSYNGLPNNLDPAAHAEILAIRKAAQNLKTRYLNSCVLYTTNEPCPMCAAAAVWANMAGIVFGANVKDLENFWKSRRNEKTSARKFVFIPANKITAHTRPKMSLSSNFMRKECLELFKLYNPQLKR